MKSVEEIKTILEGIFTNGVNLKLFLGIPEGSGIVYRHANLEDDSTHRVCRNFIASVRHYFANGELATHALSALDSRSNALAHYDFQELPPGLAEIMALQNTGGARPAREPDFFSFERHQISDVKAFVIKIASSSASVLFYKPLYPVSLIKRDQTLLIKSSNRFEHLDGEILRITGGFDLMVIDGECYVANLAGFEKHFAFTEIADRAMRVTVASLLALGLVNDSKSYLNDLKAPRRDLLRVSGSDTMRLDRERIIEYVRANDNMFGLKVVDDKIELSSKQSVKVFLKIMNDDYLRSGLTNFDYDSLAKNKLVQQSSESA